MKSPDSLIQRLEALKISLSAPANALYNAGVDDAIAVIRRHQTSDGTTPQHDSLIQRVQELKCGFKDSQRDIVVEQCIDIIRQHKADHVASTGNMVQDDAIHRREAEQEVMRVRGSYDAPGFDACVDAEMARREIPEITELDDILSNIRAIRNTLPSGELRSLINCASDRIDVAISKLATKREQSEIRLLNEQDFLDCLPNTPDDEFGQYHMDEGNLRHFLAKYLRTTRRESLPPYLGYELFTPEQKLAYQHGVTDTKQEREREISLKFPSAVHAASVMQEGFNRVCGDAGIEPVIYYQAMEAAYISLLAEIGASKREYENDELRGALINIMETWMIDTADGRCLAAQDRANKALGINSIEVQEGK